jgi:hypothetical protein
MSPLFSHKLKAAWEFTPGLSIWRLHPPVAGRIIGEVRDVETRRATFFALDAASGRCLWSAREFHDPWWVAIERVSGDRLVLHGFVSPDQPVLRGVTVVDAANGTVVHTDPEWTGSGDVLAAAGVTLDDAETSSATLFPAMHDPHNVPPEMDAVVKQWPVDDIIGGIELLELGGHTIAAAHVRTQREDTQTLTHLVKIHTTATGKVEYDDVIVASAKGIAPDAFFVDRTADNSASGMLFYLRERKALVAVKL